MELFSKPTIDDKALRYIRESLESGHLEGDGPFTKRCHAWLEALLGPPALLTHSCTAALEMSALLAAVGPGDEIIMPSYTFVSTANAFVLRGAVPVFVDIRADTLNLDETLLERAFTARTKVVVPVHYAGVACEMDSILAWARARNVFVVEDAAQCLMASYNGHPLGTLGNLGCLSFHVTKNVVSGEGGALLVNDPGLFDRASVIREKGTNRAAFRNHKVDKYEWLDVGSSFLPSDLLAALLLSQFEQCQAITERRLSVWNRYHAEFEALERQGRLTRPSIPLQAEHNGHIYHLRLPDGRKAQMFRKVLADAGIPSLTHYVPLHASPGGKQFGRIATSMKVTDSVASTLVRLPIHAEMSRSQIDRIVETVVLATSSNLE